MLIIENYINIVFDTSTNYDWVIGAADEHKDLYEFEILKDDTQITFYLNRESQYMSGRNEAVYRLYKSFPQSKVNRWLSLHQISPYFIKELINKMLNE